MIVPSSYGALSATSANVIQGRAPIFTVQYGAKRLGFTVNGTYYSESEGNLSSTDDNLFDAGLTPNDFHVITLTANDFTVQDDYYDADGDEAHPSTPFTVGSISYTWKDRTGKTLSKNDKKKMIGCGGNLKLPLTLTINLSNVQLHSKYGNPKYSAPRILKRNYKIMATQGICFARPGSLDWFDMGTGATRHSTKGGGYTTDFVPNYGFKADPTVSSEKFPTTAFRGARFQLVMTGSQTDWNYSVITNPNGAVTVDTINGWVTINNKPTGTIKVRATSKNTSNIYFDYAFTPTSLWVVPKPRNPVNIDGEYSYVEAKTACGDVSKIPSREQLSNSPYSRIGQGASIPSNASTRAIGKLEISGGAQPMKESIFSEWGMSEGGSNGTYPDSRWDRSLYWTRDEYLPGTPFLVTSDRGDVDWSKALYSCYQVACLE
ncbi:hypothetical protein RCS94_04330 [Orbaceae bacterium ac157xtp]